ncbi:MAG: BatD family protein [Gammaproteobacteria bacterium]|nr:BatD family protein [Gammaproteobacteria bacterium]
MVSFTLRITLVLMAVAFYSTTVHAQTANAYLERNPVHADETVRLVLEVDEDVSQEIDLNTLKNDFVIHSTSTSKNVNIVNGEKTTRTRWWVELEPTVEGIFTIPPIALGSATTQPLQLKVLPAGTRPADAPQDVALEVLIEPEDAYVQAQLTYTMRLELAVNVTNGRLSEPEIPNAVVQRLGDDASYEVNRNDRRIRVIERQFSIFPQVSGEFVIPAMQFAGRASENSSNSLLLDDFFGGSRVVRAQSKEVRVNVKPKPAGFSGRIWLPARDVRITESWTNNPPQFRVGEPITRTLRIEALGLSGEQLPQTPQQTIDGMRSYPDQSETNTGRDGSQVVGVREERVALVPNRAGQLTLPEVRIPWWDVGSDVEQVAVIPAQTIEVLPAETVATTTAQPDVNVETSAAEPIVDAISSQMATSSGWWPMVSAVFALLWLVTLIYLWRIRRTPVSDKKPDDVFPALRTARNAIKTACFSNDAPTAKNALLNWATTRWPQQKPLGLTGIATRLGHEPLTNELQTLDRVLYSLDTGEWSGKTLWQEFLNAEKKPTSTKSLDNVLPPLYPEVA